MPIDFGKLTDKIVKRVLDNLEGSNTDVQNAGEQVGESFVGGIEKGLDDAASHIAASSLKINKAFKDLAKKITNQSISLGGINIDFSDINIDSEDFQKKINEVFEKFKINNAIEFDSVDTEKQFKNMLALHTKYAVKLSKLQDQRPKLTSQASIKANAQAQLAVIDELKEIQKTLNQTSGISIELPRVYFGDVRELNTSIHLIEQMEKGEEKIGRQRDTNKKKLEEEIQQLRERNKILEENVGIIEEGELPPARKPRARKPKFDTSASIQVDPGDGALKHSKKDATTSDDDGIRIAIEENKKLQSSYEGLAAAVEEFVRIRNEQKNSPDKFWDLEGAVQKARQKIMEFVPDGTNAANETYQNIEHRLNRREKKEGRIYSSEEILKIVEQGIVEANAEKARLAAEQDKQKLSFIDGTTLDAKEAAMVTKYLDIMKKKMGESYDEAMHLNTALDLVFNIKNRNIEEIMGRFTNGNDASNAILNMATNMPINNQKNRDAALRSLNEEEYDRIIAERTAAVSKDKTEFQKKWEELASAMIGGDAFKDESNLNKGKIAKAFEKLGGTAKEGIDQINKMWLAGELEGKQLKNQYIQSYVDHLNEVKADYEGLKNAKAGDIDVDEWLGGNPEAKLTEEKAQALRNEAAAYEELIAKKKEYYGIVSTEEKDMIEAEAAAAGEARLEEEIRLREETRHTEDTRSVEEASLAKEREEQMKNVVQLVDNYGKSLDEVNNKLMQGSKLLNEQSQVIRLFHNSPNVFDEFDPSKVGSNQGQALGQGNYLALRQNSEFNDPAYGRHQTQWYANVQNPFNVRDELTSDQAASIIDKFLADRAEGFKNHMLSKLLDGDVVTAIKDIAYESKTTVGEIFSHIGYDAVMDGAQINVFDPSKIHRANDAVLDIGTEEFTAFNELQKKIWEEQRIIENAKAQIKKLSNQYEGQDQNQLEDALSMETLIKGFGWRDDVAKIASAFRKLTGELPKAEGISEDTMRQLADNYEFAQQNLQSYKDAVTEHEKVLDSLSAQFIKQEARIQAITQTYLDGESYVEPEKTRKHNFARTINGKSGRFSIKKFESDSADVSGIDSGVVKTETDELTSQYRRILSTIEEWKTLYGQLSTIDGGSAADIRKQMLPLIQNVSPELAQMIGGTFADGFAKGFKGIKTKDILASISRINNVDLLGSATEQINMLNGINLENFNFGELPIKETHIDFLQQAFSLLEKIDAKRKEMAGTGGQVNNSTPITSIDDIVPASAEDIIPKTEDEPKAFDKVGEAADKAADNKKKLAEANKEVAASTAPSVEGLEAEKEAIENVGEAAENVNTTWSMTRPNVEPIHLVETSDTLDNFNLPSVYMGEQGQEAVQVFAELKSEIEEMTGKPVTIDFVSEVKENGQLEAVGATLKYINEEAGITVKQFYDIARNEDGVVVATQSHERATLSATKAAKAFNTEMQKKLAEEQIKTLESRMGSLKDSTGDFTKALNDAKTAAANIDGEEGLKEFNLSLRVAGEKAKQLKSELKGQNTLDTIASMERALLTLPSRLDEVQRKLNGLGDIEGAENVSDVIESIQEEYQRFLVTGNAEDKVKLFRSLTSSMVWVNAELKNLSGKNIEMKRQETEAEKEELAKQKAARESYMDWWKTTLSEQDEVGAYEKELLERERKEKEKDERVIAARKKKEEAYEAWWQKALFNKEKAPNLNYGKTTANSVRRKFDSTEGAVDALGVTNPEVLARLDVYKQKVTEVERFRKQFASDHNAAENTGLVKQFQQAAYEAEQVRRGIKSIIDEEQKMAQISSEQGFDTIELSADQIANLKNEMIAHAKSTAQGRMEIKGWNDDHTKMYYIVTDSKGAVHEMTEALGQGTNKLYQYRTATKETGTLLQQIYKGIKVKAKELISFVIGGGGVYKVVEMLRQGIQYVREIDLALTELKKVTDETEESYDRFLETAAKTGARLGSTISAVTEATATFAKLGYSMEQATEMAEAAIVYKNVGDNIASTSDAADSIISTMKGFRFEASESMAIVDRFNEVGNRFAITSQGIGEALRLSASALSEGGNSLDESIGLITAAM